MLRWIFLSVPWLLLTPVSQVEASSQQEALDDLLAVKIQVDFATLDGVKLNKGGGYGLSNRKWQLGNFLLNLSYEQFALDWKNQRALPFGSKDSVPLPQVERYHLQAHIPYRLDADRLWLTHIGAEWAFESQVGEALSLQAYLLYSENLDALFSWQWGYHLTPRWRTDIGLVYHQAMVQLAQQSPIEAGGFFQSKNWRASWQTHYLVHKKLELRFGLEASVSNKLVLYSRDHRSLAHFYGDQGVGWHLGMSYRF